MDIMKATMRKKIGGGSSDQGGALIIMIPTDLFAHDGKVPFRKCGI